MIVAKRSTDPNDYEVKENTSSNYYGEKMWQPTETAVMRAIRVEKVHRWVYRLAVLIGVAAIIWWLVAVIGVMTIVSFVWVILVKSWPGLVGLTVVVYILWVYNHREALDAARLRGMKADE